MADFEEGYEYDDYGEEDAGITAEDCWTVISSFFEAKGLVSQQLDSFDEFVSTTMQELVEQEAEMANTGEHPTRLVWEDEDGDPEGEKSEKAPDRVYIGKLPIMLKSKYCILRDLDEDDLYAWNECPYDQGGYFIINGSEKVLIAQERSAANIVQVFKKAPPSPTPFIAEIRSALEKGSRLNSNMTIN